MPLLRRPYTGPYDHERRRTTAVPLLGVIALLAAGTVGWAIGESGGSGAARTVTQRVTVMTPPGSVYQHTPQGAVAAAQAFFYQRAVTPQTGPLAVTNPRFGQVHGDWALLYTITSYTPHLAEIRTWGPELSYGYGTTGLDWSFTDVDVAWNGGRWMQTGDLTIVPEGATPPPNGTTGGADRAFGALLYPYRRFPDAP